MGRMHLFEWEDLPWFPHMWRNYMTDMLRHAFTLWAPRAGFVTKQLNHLLDATGSDQIVDLCSGSSGPILWFREQLETQRGAPVRVMLTDKYPNLPAYRYLAEQSDGRVRFRSEPVDATAPPADLGKLCTMFACLHHFRPQVARRILESAARQRRALAVFEVSERRAKAILLAGIGGPLAVLLLTPFVRPFRWGRLFWTYLVPVVPLALAWDAVVSCLRTYSPAELEEMTRGLAVDGYRWEVGQHALEGMPARATWLLGYPVESAGQGQSIPAVPMR